MTSTLQYELSSPAALSEELRREMYALFARCYECVSRAQFERDLAEKGTVILLRSPDGKVRGFSTQQVLDMNFEGEAVRLLFSGDTIVEPAWWGSPELMKGWCEVAAETLRVQPEKRLFWFLISKGYRTYLLLPLFFHHYVPAVGHNAPAAWKRLLDQAAHDKFGAAYDPVCGLVRFPKSQGHLRGQLAQIPGGRHDDPHVRFFRERNPDFASGVELACLAEVTLENTHGLGRRWLGRALRETQLAATAPT